MLEVLVHSAQKMRGLREVVARALTRRNAAIKENVRYFSELSDIRAADGAPPLAKGRKVIIYSPSKTPMQSGNSQTLAGKSL